MASQDIINAQIQRVSGSERLGDRQCTGTNKDGTRCKSVPMRGGVVCVLHGGNSPMALRAAKNRLLALVEPATAILALAVTRCVFSRNELGSIVCEVHGADGCPEWPVRVNAAKALLDRSGHGPQAKLTIEKEDTSDLERLDLPELAGELEQLARDLRTSERVSDVAPRDSQESPPNTLH